MSEPEPPKPRGPSGSPDAAGEDRAGATASAGAPGAGAPGAVDPTATAAGATAPARGATGAGRGVLYLAFAKFYFMFVGLVMQLRLPAILSRGAFGSYSLVSNIASLVNNVLVTGTIQAVSRFSAQEPAKARRVQQAGLRMHVRLGLLIGLAFVAAAPLVSWALLDASKTGPLMLAGLIIAGYSFYAVFVGTANGLHQFHKQAGLDVTFATLRAAGVLGMAMAGLGVLGVIGGWVAAVGLILCASIVWIGMPGPIPREARLPVLPLVQFFAGVALYLFLFNALMFADSILIKRLTTEYFAAEAAAHARAIAEALPWVAASQLGGGLATGSVTGYAADPSVLADVQNAYYAAVQNLARLSYQAIIAATFVVFPLVSRSTFADDRETTRRYLQVTSRYSLMFAGMIAVVMAANPADVLALVYAPDYQRAGAPALPLLAFGNVAFSMLAINGTILNGAGQTRAAVAVAAASLVLAIAGNWIAIPLAAPHGRVLEASAAVTAGAMIVGAVASGLVLRRRLGGYLPLVSFARIALATAAALGVGRALAFHGKLMTLVEAAAVAASFLAVLIATRELGRRDLQAIRAVRARRAAGGGDT
jgi:stage V sporulation protein B